MLRFGGARETESVIMPPVSSQAQRYRWVLTSDCSNRSRSTNGKYFEFSALD
jgi:hypothetical protein